ncbi:hypothetical protein SLA2020_189040 [Shorea laevis]
MRSTNKTDVESEENIARISKFLSCLRNYGLMKSERKFFSIKTIDSMRILQTNVEDEVLSHDLDFAGEDASKKKES